MKYGTIVPLIGGITVAAKQVTGVDPAFLLSYSPFGENDENAKTYFKNVPHYLLDSENQGGFDATQHKDVDFVNALCPCAGLSLLSSGNAEQRSTMNHWMLESAKFVTSKVRPKVFWGENAPQLYTKFGEGVRNQLKEIAEQNGYSFSIYFTNTMYHGIPQNRKRTFYFFWRDSNAPVFDYYRKPLKPTSEYFAEITPGITHHTPDDLKAAQDYLMTNPYVMFLQDKHKGKGLQGLRDYVEKDMKGTTMLTYLLRSEQLEEARDWLRAKGFEKFAKEAERVFHKLSIGGGFWDGSMPIYHDIFSTLISRTAFAIHPREDRIITTRECMHLMGLPEDFNLVTRNINHICQNVPVKTGSDMTREVVKFVNGEAKISNSTFMMQSNLNERVDVQESSLLSF